MRTLDEAAADDRRVRVVRSLDGGVAAASRAGLAAATGELVALVDHADRLEPDALAEMSAAMDEGVDVAYSDHDVIDASGFYVDPVYKPDFSPERLRSQNYVTRLVVARRSLLDVVGGFRDGLEGAEDHDLILRLTEAAGRWPTCPVCSTTAGSRRRAGWRIRRRRGRPPPAPGRSPTIAPVRASTPPSRRHRSRGAIASSGEWQHVRSSAW